MASPTPSIRGYKPAHSPPSNAPSPPSSLSGKRQISSSNTPTVSSKKPKTMKQSKSNTPSVSRKNSLVGLTKPSHPLRQTSFPPDEAAQRIRRSPSVASNATTSFTRGNSVDRMLVPVNTGNKGGGGEEEDGEEEDDEGRDEDDGGMGGSGEALSAMAEASRAKEEEEHFVNFACVYLLVDRINVSLSNVHRAKRERERGGWKRLFLIANTLIHEFFWFRELLEQFDEDQMARYEAFRRSNLNKPSVKKVKTTILFIHPLNTIPCLRNLD